MGKTRSEVVRDALRRQVQLERLAALQRYGREQAEERGSAPRMSSRWSTICAPSSAELCELPSTPTCWSRRSSPLVRRAEFEEAIDGRLQLVLPELVMEELERILTGKLGFDPERWLGVETFLADLAADSVPAAGDSAEPVTGDPDDGRIQACVAAAGVQALVSGDRRHLLPLKEHRGVRILSQQALLAEPRNR